MTVQHGVLYIVSTPIGNLDDITHRAVTVLAGVDAVVAEDTRKTTILLRHLQVTKPLISYHAHNEHRTAAGLINRLEAGESLALVSDAGTPGISDPGFYVIREAIRRDIRVIPIPGPSAFLAALVASGLPLDRFVFEGFLPPRKGRTSRITSYQSEDRTIILYESPHRILRTLADLRRILGDRYAVIGRELTKTFEEIVRGRLGSLELHFQTGKIKGEFVLLIAGHSYRGDEAETLSDTGSR